MHKESSFSFKDFTLFNWLGLIAFVWFFYFSITYGKVESESTILVFPDTQYTKNYELIANVTRDTQMLFLLFPQTTYILEQFSWPNGGYASFSSCIVPNLNEMKVCTSDSGDTYGIKVSEFTPPESNYDN